MTLLDCICAAREGGHVQRVHGTPHIGEYTVGKHSFDALSILLVAHPNPTVNLIKAVLWHDVAERWVGDLPAPVLNAFPELKEAYERAEAQVQQQKGLELPPLAPDEKLWLKLVDRVEFWLWCKDQLLLGNRHVEAMEQRTRELINEMPLPDVYAQNLVDQVSSCTWARSTEL